MKNEEIATLFEKTAKLLELEDANPFRIRAYQNASLNLMSLSGDIEEIAKKGGLRDIPGIGEDLSSKIEEYLKTGKIEFYEKLLAKTPPILIQMLRIPGMGPKTSRLIYAKFKPKNLEGLEKVVKSEAFLKVPGIKEKTAQNILEGIAFIKKHHERTLLGQGLPLARQICEQLAKVKGVEEITYAGSVRRMCETIHDIDILAASKSPKLTMDAFVKLDGVQKILGHGPTKSSLIIKPGIQVDLRVVKKDEFGAALLYFTGSKGHNVKLRSLAKKKGWKVNEYGLFNEKTGKKLASKTEEEMYRALGLSYVPPELREDQGEIEAARGSKLPRLVTREDIKGDFHSHSNWTDGLHKIEEMVEGAKHWGLEYLVLTDHSQSLTIAKGLSPKKLRQQIQVVRNLNKKLKGITLLIGSEVDILENGSLDFEDDVLKELDVVVASVHSRFKQDKKTMTKRIIRAMQNKYVNVIGHPTGRLIGEREAYQVEFEELFHAAKETNTALEINSYPQRLDLNFIHAKRARERGVMLAINSDSHNRNHFENFEYGIATARRAWCRKEDILNCLPLNELKKKLNKYKN